MILGTISGCRGRSCVFASLPALDVVLHLTTQQRFCAVLVERTGYDQLVQQLVHQQAGPPAALQHEGRPAHGAEVALQEEAGETLLAVGVTAGCVQGLYERLQTDVAHEVIVNLILVHVLVVLLQFVRVAT